MRTEVLQRLAEMIGGLEVAPNFRDRSGMECSTASPDKHRVAGIAAATFAGRAFQPSQSPAIRMSAMPNMINDDNSGAGMHLVDNSIISDPNPVIPN